MPTRPAKKRAAVRRFTNEELAAIAKDYKKYDGAVKDATAKKKECQETLVQAMQSSRDKTFTNSGIKVTLTEPSSLVYDEPSIYTALTPAQRRLCFDEHFEMSLLPPAKRREMVAAIAEMLTPSLRRRCTTRTLNIDKLSQAIQAGKIPAEVAAENSETVNKAPYVTITYQGGT